MAENQGVWDTDPDGVPASLARAQAAGAMPAEGEVSLIPEPSPPDGRDGGQVPDHGQLCAHTSVTF